MASTKVKGISGQIAGVNLSSFLQMVEMEQKTCTVNVITKRNIGHIYFHIGEIVDAGTVNSKHTEALYDILSWHNFIIEVEPNPSRRENVVNLSLIHIIMESTRRADEIEKRNPGAAEAEEEESIPLKTMISSEFCLEIGVRLLIEFDDMEFSFKSSLVGIEHGEYLLLKEPAPFSAFDRERIETGDMIIKALYKGTIYAFRSKLTAIISTPTRLMFIRYPDNIEHHELRAHKRFKCSIITQAGFNNTERGGVIENISMGGCRCTMETRLSDIRSPRSLLNETISFRCRLPGTQKEARFIGQVRNTQNISDEISVGVEFTYTDDSDEARKLIGEYIKLIEYAGENV